MAKCLLTKYALTKTDDNTSSDLNQTNYLNCHKKRVTHKNNDISIY